MPKISVILPALNEEGNVRAVSVALGHVLKEYDYEIIFVDGCSQDKTLNILRDLHGENHRVRFLSMSRNFGHQQALKAGLDFASGDCLIFMDCDLQHPPELVPRMLAEWEQGYEVVYTVREENNNVPWLRRRAGNLFYRVLNLLSDVPIIQGAADFFLIDRKVADVLRGCQESPLFLRGMIAWVGYRQTGVRYRTNKRFSGTTKYSLRRMIEFAIDGVTSFSIKPLRLSVFCGGFVSLGAFLYLLYVVYAKVFTHQIIPGWTSVITCVLFLGGMQLMVMGIIGEYLGKLFMSAKQRPNYIIRERSGL